MVGDLMHVGEKQMESCEWKCGVCGEIAEGKLWARVQGSSNFQAVSGNLERVERLQRKAVVASVMHVGPG